MDSAASSAQLSLGWMSGAQGSSAARTHTARRARRLAAGARRRRQPASGQRARSCAATRRAVWLETTCIRPCGAVRLVQSMERERERASVTSAQARGGHTASAPQPLQQRRGPVAPWLRALDVIGLGAFGAMPYAAYVALALA